MTTKSMIDMSRSNLLYISGVGLVMLVSLIVSNIPSLAFSQYWDFPHRERVCAALFMFGALAGALAIQRNMMRAKTPWQIPQSQVSIPYTLFFTLSLAAVVISR